MQANPQADQALRSGSDAGDVPGVVAVAATSDGIIYEGAFGRRDLGRPDPMTVDSVFWIASMTKAVTSAAAMQLVERGKLSLEGPIADVLPNFAKCQVLEGYGADGRPLLRPAKGEVTLRQLLTHTAGFSYEIWNGDTLRYITEKEIPSITTCQNQALARPLNSDPGTRWEYGINIDFVGKAVEAVSGKTIGVYLKENIFEPLGMNDTAFKITPDMRQRLVGMHARGEDGNLVAMPFELEQQPEFEMGGGGLYGTARDYIAFTRMLLNRGTLNGNRVLEEATVANMLRNHIGDLDVQPLETAMPPYSNNVDLYPEQRKKWGLSFLINTEPTAEGRSAGSVAWAGLANTYYWIDPTRDVTGVILTQLLPFADPKALGLYSGFERATYANLGGRARAA